MKKIIYLIPFLIFLNCNKSNNDFKLCQGKLNPYYYPELKYKGGFYEIKKYFYSKFMAIESTKDNGIVRIRFNINCRGESGNFEIETYSLDYKSNRVNNKITKQLIVLTKNLKDWIPATNEEGEKVNSHKFFAFKIINGKLEDILPK